MKREWVSFITPHLDSRFQLNSLNQSHLLIREALPLPSIAKEHQSHILSLKDFGKFIDLACWFFCRAKACLTYSLGHPSFCYITSVPRMRSNPLHRYCLWNSWSNKLNGAEASSHLWDASRQSYHDSLWGISEEESAGILLWHLARSISERARSHPATFKFCPVLRRISQALLCESCFFYKSNRECILLQNPLKGLETSTGCLFSRVYR